jgi:uncharacterized protein (TIGR02466 family)
MINTHVHTHGVFRVQIDQSNWELFTSLADGYASMGIQGEQIDLLLDKLVYINTTRPVASDAEHTMRVRQLNYIRTLVSEARWTETWQRYNSTDASLNPPLSSRTHALLPPAEVFLPFSTCILFWNSTAEYLSQSDVQSLLHASMESFELMKRQLTVAQEQNYESFGPTQLNNEYFLWQIKVMRETGHPWEGFTLLPAFAKLQTVMRLAAKALLLQHGYNEELATAMSKRKLVVWATIHTNGSAHPAHDHSDSVVSGVFYVQTPPHATGRIVFTDPRNSLYDRINELNGKIPEPMPPPFHYNFALRPGEGSVVVFPSWLIHRVEPMRVSHGRKTADRVSFAFNLFGEWEDTAHLELRYTPTERDSKQHKHVGMIALCSVISFAAGLLAAMAIMRRPRDHKKRQ